tara:strand:- start:8685 stop:9596 length:912 start_codon:yes stop_codon:yes gene_type:complete
MTRTEFGKIQFVGKTKIFTVLSLVMILASLAFLFSKGLKYGIDFAGGTEAQIQFSSKVNNVNDLRGLLEGTSLADAQVVAFGDLNEYLVRFQNDESTSAKEQNEAIEKRIKELRTTLESKAAGAYEIRRVDSVGPQVGAQLKRNGLLAIFYSLLLILIYVGLRFDYEYAPGAVVCLFHDAIITLGIFALIEHEVNVSILAAVLTIIGYSLNDTIINFDRIRENRERHKGASMSDIVNLSINQVLSRTILTSVTTLMAVGALYMFAGGVITDFAFVLGIGIIIGTYSSIYVAAPLVLVFQNFRK